jgi:DNA-binding response OmpR family regulator
VGGHRTTVASVLVHEHDAHVRALLEAQLAALGHTPLLPGEGSDRWSPAEIDVAVIEPVTLPGLHLAYELRASRPDLPLVFASIAPPTEETRELGAVVHLVKPFRLGELADAVTTALASPAALAG